MFPLNPSDGDRVTLPNGVTYEWQVFRWVIVSIPADDTAVWGSIGGNILDQPDLEAAFDEKMDLVPTAALGHLAEFDADGQVVDAGGTLAAIEDRLDSIEALGHFVGSFNTRAAVPSNTSGFTQPITVNDFVTVRADETQSGATTRYIATAIAADGTITWTYDITYSTDITNKMELVPAAREYNLAMFDDAGQVEDAVIADRTITCDIDDLQETIDALPKYLNGEVTIAINPGTTTDDILVHNFYGGGHLHIRGAMATQTFTHEINRIDVRWISIARLTIEGISTTSTTGTAWSFNNVSTAFAYIYRCNATGGLPTDNSNLGFYANEASHIYCSGCHCSDKFRAFWARSGRMRLATTYGSNNNVVNNSEVSGILQVTSTSQATGTTQYRVQDASILVRPDGFVQTLVTTSTQSYTVDIENLQTTINSLPKTLNRPYTINVNPGDFVGTITIENFIGTGSLQILGPAATGDFTRQVTRVIIQNCNVGYVYIRGISANATTGNAWYISQVTSPMLYIDRCNAAGDGTPGSGGNPATTTNMGFYSFRSTGLYCENCTVSDKYRAFYARSGRMFSGAEHGTNNTVVYNSEVNGQLQIQARGTIEGTTLYRSVDGSFITTELGDFITSTGISYPRRSSDLGIVLTTDQILAHGQSLATLIERRIQDQIYVTTNTFYTLRIHVRQGIATNATFRLHGMTIRAYVQVFIDPDVTLSGIVIYGNTSMSLVVNNQGTINGNVTIMFNTSTVDSVGYNQNYAATVLPVYPTTHPLSGQAIPIQHSRVTGGITIMQNDSKNHVYCLVGQHCQVGQPDVHGVVAAPSVGSTTNGAINLLYNRAIGSCYVIVYATYMENDPVIPGPVVVGRIYNYYNESNSSIYNTIQSGWREGTQPTIESAYVYQNKTTSTAYQQIGNGRPATTFAGNWTAVAEADPSTTNRNTVVLTANMLPGREATVVGMGFTFVNAATTSSASNYSGTFKRVTAYDPATRTVTLSANFALARPAGATCYFFPYAAQTDIYYGTSYKIEAMLQDAYNTGQPYGLRQADGNNLGRAYRVTAIDTTLKTITISPGLNANGVYNATFVPCGTFSPICIMDFETTFTKTAANTIRGTGDLMLYPYSDRMLLGRRITGPGITGSAEVTNVQWVNNNLLLLTLNTDPNVPIDASVHTYNIRRAPGHGHYAVCYNHCGTDAYINVGYPGAAENGGIKLRSAIAAYNHCGAACFINTNDFMGDVVNANGAVRCGYIDVYYNVTGSSAYMYGRANNNVGGDGYLGRIRVYSNYGGYEAAIVIGTYTTVSREVLFYNNTAGYRAWVDCELPGGVTISAATAPQLRGYLNVYRIIAPHVWVQRLNIKPALIAENGLATSDRCLLLQDINGRAYIASASMWLDISNNTAANSSCVYANVNTNFEYGFAVPSTYGGTQCYALRVVDNANVRIAARPAIGPKILLSGYTQAHIASTLALDNIYRGDHLEGREANVVILQRGEPVDDTRAPIAYYTTPGTYTFVVPITAVWEIVAGGAGGGGAVYLDVTPRTAGGGSGALAAGVVTSLNAGTSLTVTVGARGIAFVGAATAGAGTAGGNSSVTGGGITVTANGGGGGVVNATTGTGGAGGTYTVTGAINQASAAGDAGTATSGGKRAWKDLVTVQGRVVVSSGRGGAATTTSATSGFDGSVLIFMEE